MSEMTYTKCNVCYGYLVHGPVPLPCACTRSKTPGYDPTGITVGQIERAVEAEKKLNALLSGMPGQAHKLLVEIRQAVIVEKYRKALAERITSSKHQEPDEPIQSA